MDSKNKVSFEWSVTVIVITAVVSVLLLYCIYFIANNYYKTSAAVGISVVILLFLYVATQMPIYLCYNADGIVIKHLIGQTKIPVRNLTSIEKADDNVTAYSIRCFGSGGFGGYLGKFSNNMLGNYTMCVTQKKNLVLIKTTKRQYIISCTHYDELISYYENRIKGL